MLYQNPLCAVFNHAVLRYGAPYALAKVPAGFDADKICFPAKFVSSPPLARNQNMEFLDPSGQPLDGTRYHPIVDGNITSGFCSLRALMKLSHDPRVQELWFGNPVDVEKILSLQNPKP